MLSLGRRENGLKKIPPCKLGYCKTPSKKWRLGHKRSYPLQLGNVRNFFMESYFGKKRMVEKNSSEEIPSRGQTQVFRSTTLPEQWFTNREASFCLHSSHSKLALLDSWKWLKDPYWDK
jgi:hypothetical protein